MLVDDLNLMSLNKEYYKCPPLVLSNYYNFEFWLSRRMTDVKMFLSNFSTIIHYDYK